MQASIHPIQSERAKVGSWVVGREGTPELVFTPIVKCLWRGEGVESVVMMYGA